MSTFESGSILDQPSRACSYRSKPYCGRRWLELHRRCADPRHRSERRPSLDGVHARTARHCPRGRRSGRSAVQRAAHGRRHPHVGCVFGTTLRPPEARGRRARLHLGPLERLSRRAVTDPIRCDFVLCRRSRLSNVTTVVVLSGDVCPTRVGPTDFDHAPHPIDRAYESSAQWTESPRHPSYDIAAMLTYRHDR